MYVMYNVLTDIGKIQFSLIANSVFCNQFQNFYSPFRILPLRDKNPLCNIFLNQSPGVQKYTLFPSKMESSFTDVDVYLLCQDETDVVLFTQGQVLRKKR